MPLIVDTYNVLHVVGVLPPENAGLDTAGLLEMIGTSRFAGDAVTLVCDGHPAPGDATGKTGGIGIRYAGRTGVSADELIMSLIRKSHTPRQLTVVSSDREIRRAARRRRCRAVDSDRFLRMLLADLRARPRRRGRLTGPPPADTISPHIIDEAETIWREGTKKDGGKVTGHRHVLEWLVFAAAAFLAGCGGEEPPPPAAGPAIPATTPSTSPWHVVDGGDAMVAVSGTFAEELAAASAEARSAASDASDRWRAEPLETRRWAIKWRAETADGDLEFVWVEPLRWTRHRIEGRLASIPNRELACGKTVDELVSFPAEELADWFRYGDTPDTPPEGGFTVKLLEAEYGKPPESP